MTTEKMKGLSLLKELPIIVRTKLFPTENIRLKPLKRTCQSFASSGGQTNSEGISEDGLLIIAFWEFNLQTFDNFYPVFVR